ncbi:MAG: hypothetical protein AAGE03_04650 [Pseudomonadota bacterium]
MHLVITGITLRSPFYKPLFLFHAIRSLQQAAAHPGNRHADQRVIDGIHHTATLWTDVAASRDYGTTGPHRQAVSVFAKIGTGKVYHGTADQVPDWPEMRRLYDAAAQDV